MLIADDFWIHENGTVRLSWRFFCAQNEGGEHIGRQQIDHSDSLLRAGKACPDQGNRNGTGGSAAGCGRWAHWDLLSFFGRLEFSGRLQWRRQVQRDATLQGVLRRGRKADGYRLRSFFYLRLQWRKLRQPLRREAAALCWAVPLPGKLSPH